MATSHTRLVEFAASVCPALLLAVGATVWADKADADEYSLGLLSLAEGVIMTHADIADAEKHSLGRGWFVDATFSHDGRQVLTASYEKIAQIWDVETGREIRRFEGHLEELRGAVFGPSGKQVLTWAGSEGDMGRYSIDNTARLWDVATGNEIRRFEGHTQLLQTATLSPDGKRLLTTSRDATARLWDTDSGAELFRFPVDCLTRSSFSPDGSKILGIYNGDKASRVVLWDANSGAELCRLKGHTKAICTAQFSADGQQVLTASEDSSTRIWDARTGQMLRRYAGHQAHVLSAAFSANGNMIVTASTDGTARLWDAKSVKEARRFTHSWPVWSALLSSDGKRVLASWKRIEDRGPRAGIVDYFASLWNVETGAEIRQFSMRPGSHIALFSPDGKEVFSTSTYTTLWDATTGEIIRQYK